VKQFGSDLSARLRQSIAHDVTTRRTTDGWIHVGYQCISTFH